MVVTHVRSFLPSVHSCLTHLWSSLPSGRSSPGSTSHYVRRWNRVCDAYGWRERMSERQKRWADNSGTGNDSPVHRSFHSLLSTFIIFYSSRVSLLGYERKGVQEVMGWVTVNQERDMKRRGKIPMKREIVHSVGFILLQKISLVEISIKDLNDIILIYP